MLGAVSAGAVNAGGCQCWGLSVLATIRKGKTSSKER